MRVLVTGGAGFTPPLLENDVRKAGPRPFMHYVYVLRSLSNRGLYIGCTSNLRVRMRQHQDGRSPATKGKGPWELVYYEAYRQEADAYQRERSLKQFGGAYRQLRKRLAKEL